MDPPRTAPADPAAAKPVIQRLLENLHSRTRELNGGAPANYIPELAAACPDDFGIVLATTDGHTYAVGDTAKPFTIQSISKPFVFGLGLKTLGRELMYEKIDVEPSGEAFNALSLNPESGKPRNPMINAGAIAASALLCERDPAGSEALILDHFSQLAGRPLDLNERVYRSEKETGHRNRAIGHMLRNFGIIDSDPERALDLYFRQCSIAVTCHDLAIMGATLACKGRNPVTGATPLDADTTVRILAVMGSCGMYDYAGQWLHDVGIPAKSGVGGGILAILPGSFAIAVYSPPLDGYGNSVRGVAVCRALSSSVGLSLFHTHPRPRSAIRLSRSGAQLPSRRWRSDEERRLLQALRPRIRILEIQGVLDFAALEQLCRELTKIRAGENILILDFHHLQHCPGEIMALLEDELRGREESGLMILLTRGRHLSVFRDREHLFEGRIPLLNKLDTALELAEDSLLRTQANDSSAAEASHLPGARRRPSSSAMTAAQARETALLRLLPRHYRTLLLRRMKIRRYAAGEPVLRRGEPGEELYLVRSGRFTTSIDAITPDGRVEPSRLATFVPGMVFGEISFISGNFRTADVIAVDDGTCWVMERRDFDALKQQNPDVVIELLQALSFDLGRKLAHTSLQLARSDSH